MDRGARPRGARRPRSMPWRLGELLAACASGALLLTAPCAEAAPVNTSLPVISGTLEPGQTLTATPGSWSDSGATVTSYWYQWFICLESECTGIENANSSTYTITAADYGEALEVGVIAYDSAGDFTSVLSNMTSEVGPDYTHNSPSYTLSESTGGAGSLTGLETSPEAAGRTADANLTCPGPCGALDPYPLGTEIELIATPATGSAFLGWSGACSGSAPACSLTMSGNESVTARFTALPAPTSLLEGKETDAPPGGAAAGAGALGEGEEVPTSSVAHLPARLLGLRALHGHHLQATVACQQARPCHLTLAVSSDAPRARLVASRTLTLAAGGRTHIGLALNHEGARLLGRRHRLPVTAHLMLRNGRRSVAVGTGRLTLTT